MPTERTDQTHRRSRRDWVVDVLFLFLAVGVAAVFYSRTVHGQWATVPVVVSDITVAALGCAALWWRRRWPVAIALVITAASVVSALATGVLFVMMFTVAVHRRLPAVVAVAAANLAASTAFYLLRPSQVPYWTLMGWTAALLVMVVAWGLFVRARRQLIESLRERARQAEATAHLRVVQARQLERARIAREMHDVLAHRISLVSLHAGALEFRPDAPPDEVARAAGVIRSSAHQALEDLRTVIGVLREPPAEAPGRSSLPERPQPTLADLPALAEQSRDAGERVRLRIRMADRNPVPDALGRTLYRVVQEGLTNAHKHAPGALVEIDVEGAPGPGISVEVANPAAVTTSAGPPIPGTGTGLIGLVERVTLAGGGLEYGPTEAGGFRLRAWLPWGAGVAAEDDLPVQPDRRTPTLTG